jgi:hypothetical protein
MAGCSIPTDATGYLFQSVQLSRPRRLFLPRFCVHFWKLLFAALLPGSPWSNTHSLWCLFTPSSSGIVCYVDIYRHIHKKDWQVSAPDLVWYEYNDSWVRLIHRSRCQLVLGQNHLIPDCCRNWCWTKFPKPAHCFAESRTGKFTILQSYLLRYPCCFVMLCCLEACSSLHLTDRFNRNEISRPRRQLSGSHATLDLLSQLSLAPLFSRTK